jgi:hypothetical protein
MDAQTATVAVVATPDCGGKPHCSAPCDTRPAWLMGGTNVVRPQEGKISLATVMEDIALGHPA